MEPACARGAAGWRHDRTQRQASRGNTRGASIRIPIGTVEKGWKGWLEDRRPNSAADPYKVAARIIKTVKIAEASLSLTSEQKKVA